MESLTVHYLARELDAAWASRRVACFAMRDAPAFVRLGVVGGSTVRFDLSRPEVRVVTDEPDRERGPLDGYEVTSVIAPTDDRRLVIRLTKPGKFRGSTPREAELVVSLVPQVRGASLVSADGHRFGAIGSAIAAPRDPRPVPAPDELAAAAESHEAGALAGFRWIGPAVAEWLLRVPGEIAHRYQRICELPPAHPSRCDGILLPFPFCDGAKPATSLIEAASAVPAEHTGPRPDARSRAIARMREQLDQARDAPVVRAAADALMALPAGGPVPPLVTLPDGAEVEVEPRVGDTPQTVAERLYAKARAMERARTMLPSRIARMESLPSDPAAREAAPAGSDREAPRRPFKSFTSRGGLEIRVGRSARDNDALTFHESSPSDVWLHARDAAGSHVVLRWSSDEPPPAPDLEDAALLAAWHSRARGSTIVPVDWTRRRYVRKPRGAAPGSVVVQRAQTVFARPTAAAVRAIRDRS